MLEAGVFNPYEKKVEMKAGIGGVDGGGGAAGMRRDEQRKAW